MNIPKGSFEIFEERRVQHQRFPQHSCTGRLNSTGRESPVPPQMGAPGSANGIHHPHLPTCTFEKWLSYETRTKGGCVFLLGDRRRKQTASC